jgi:hypothetical protein
MSPTGKRASRQEGGNCLLRLLSFICQPQMLHHIYARNTQHSAARSNASSPGLLRGNCGLNSTLLSHEVRTNVHRSRVSCAVHLLRSGDEEPRQSQKRLAGQLTSILPQFLADSVVSQPANGWTKTRKSAMKCQTAMRTICVRTTPGLIATSFADTTGMQSRRKKWSTATRCNLLCCTINVSTIRIPINGPSLTMKSLNAMAYTI